MLSKGWRSANQLLAVAMSVAVIVSVVVAGAVMGTVTATTADATRAARWVLLCYGLALLAWAVMVEPRRSHTFADPAWRYLPNSRRTIALLAELDASPGSVLATCLMCGAMVAAGRGVESPLWALAAPLIAAGAVATWGATIRRIVALVASPAISALIFVSCFIVMTLLFSSDEVSIPLTRRALAEWLVSQQQPQWLTWIPIWWPFDLVADIAGRGGTTISRIALAVLGMAIPLRLMDVVPAAHASSPRYFGHVPISLRGAARYVERAFWFRSPRFLTAIGIAAVFSFCGGAISTKSDAPPAALFAIAPIGILCSAVLNNSFGIGSAGAGMAAIVAWPMKVAFDERLYSSVIVVTFLSAIGALGAALIGGPRAALVHGIAILSVGVFAGAVGLVVSVVQPREVAYHGIMTTTATPVGQALATGIGMAGAVWLTVLRAIAARSSGIHLGVAVGGLAASLFVAARCVDLAGIYWSRHPHRPRRDEVAP